MFVPRINPHILLFVVVNTKVFHPFHKRAFFVYSCITHTFKQRFSVTVRPKPLVGMVEVGFEPISPSSMHSHTTSSV